MKIDSAVDLKLGVLYLDLSAIAIPLGKHVVTYTQEVNKHAVSPIGLKAC